LLAAKQLFRLLVAFKLKPCCALLQDGKNAKTADDI